MFDTVDDMTNNQRNKGIGPLIQTYLTLVTNPIPFTKLHPAHLQFPPILPPWPWRQGRDYSRLTLSPHTNTLSLIFSFSLTVSLFTFFLRLFFFFSTLPSSAQTLAVLQTNPRSLQDVPFFISYHLAGRKKYLPLFV